MLKLVSILVCKASNYDDLLSQQKAMVQQFHTHPEELTISSVVELSHKEFDNFKSDFLSERKFLENRNAIILVKEIGKSDFSGIIVQASGFSYARYVGIPMKKVDFKLCPSCGELYCEHPAISRKDNKTEICPKCGTEEALLHFCANYKFINFLNELHNRANEFDVRIVISKPDSEDIIITPEK